MATGCNLRDALIAADIQAAPLLRLPPRGLSRAPPGRVRKGEPRCRRDQA